MAVDAVVDIAVVGSVFFLNHVGVAGVCAEGAHLPGKEELGIIVILYYGKTLLPGLDPDADVHHMIDVAYIQGVHNTLQELETPPAGGDQDSAVADRPLCRADTGACFIQTEHLLSQGKVHPFFGEFRCQFLYKLQAPVGSQVGLLDLQQLDPQAFGPLCVDTQVRFRQDGRGQLPADQIEVLLRLFTVPVLRGKTDGIGEVHLAVVPEPPGGVILHVQDQYPGRIRGLGEVKGRPQPRGTRADDDVVVVFLCVLHAGIECYQLTQAGSRAYSRDHRF